MQIHPVVDPAKPPTVQILTSLSLAIVLVLMFFPQPHAGTLSAQTWRVELAAAVFLCGTVVLARQLARVDRIPQLSRRMALLFLLFAGWSLTSLIWAPSRASAWHHTLLWCEYILFFVLGISWARGQKRVIWMTFAWVAAIIGAVTVIDFATLPDFAVLEGTLRARYSAYGELLVTISPLLWVLCIYQRSWRRLMFCLLPAAAGWGAAMMSLSKGVFLAGIVGFGVASVGCALLSRGISRARLLAVIGVWLVLTVGVQFGSSYLTQAHATVDYLSGKADPTRETSTARVFVWRVGLTMVRDHLLVGVGADNFGREFNRARAEYRLSHPTDPPDEASTADALVGRAHNEVLEVLAELGVVGIVLFVAPWVVFAWAAVRQLFLRRRLSPVFWASLGGMAAFAASSMVSSFALRVPQNGIAFFLVLAVAVTQIAKDRSRHLPIPTPVAAIVVGVLLITFGLKAAAEVEVIKADREPDNTRAEILYRRAMVLDPDYASAIFDIGWRAKAANDYTKAADDIRSGIDMGLGIVDTYHFLAQCYERAGDNANAESTFKEGLSIFPRSVFLHVRYSIFLESIGRTDDAASELALAREIDKPQANGWYSLITRGSVATFFEARNNKEVALPADLQPEGLIHEYLDRTPFDTGKQ